MADLSAGAASTSAASPFQSTCTSTAPRATCSAATFTRTLDILPQRLLRVRARESRPTARALDLRVAPAENRSRSRLSASRARDETSRVGARGREIGRRTEGREGGAGGAHKRRVPPSLSASLSPAGGPHTESCAQRADDPRASGAGVAIRVGSRPRPPPRRKDLSADRTRDAAVDDPSCLQAPVTPSARDDTAWINIRSWLNGNRWSLACAQSSSESTGGSTRSRLEPWATPPPSRSTPAPAT